jgi:uncharacterized LabA/DUF88 family protein
MERMIIFMDFANIDAGSRRHGRLDYGHLLNYLAEGRFLIDAYNYVPIDPRRSHERERFIDDLWQQGWNVQPKMGKIAGDTYKCNVDVEMTIDMMRAAQEIRPDIIVLCSGDEDFLPVVLELRRMGIRTEVASFEQNVGRRLALQASGFISLDAYLGEANNGPLEDPFQTEETPPWPEDGFEGLADDHADDLEPDAPDTIPDTINDQERSSLVMLNGIPRADNYR